MECSNLIESEKGLKCKKCGSEYCKLCEDCGVNCIKCSDFYCEMCLEKECLDCGYCGFSCNNCSPEDENGIKKCSTCRVQYDSLGNEVASFEIVEDGDMEVIKNPDNSVIRHSMYHE
jgi:hypothetical protein